jgi:3-oxoacyl-[acyl-carrier-protein] synthase-1
MAKLNNIRLSDLGIVSSLGQNKQETWQSLFKPADQVMSQSDQYLNGHNVALGLVNAPLPDMSEFDAIFNSRCNGLALLAYRQIEGSVKQAIAKYGPSRVGVIIGTSTSGTYETELAFARQVPLEQQKDQYHYKTQEMGAVANFIAVAAEVEGPAFCISTACSSGAKALVSAYNMVQSGMLDAVICGGADSLCKLTVNGFHALESLSFEISNPFSVNRKGINIGEGAALFLLERGDEGIALLGVGESSDAHHMSAPHPEGDGALASMTKALNMADIAAQDLDYINLHGTATEKNDQMEAKAISRLGAAKIPASSTKPFTGHTLAGAGAIEAGICYLAMSEFNANGQIPPHSYDGQYDPNIEQINLCQPNSNKAINYCLSNSFAFGGSNVSLVLARCHE